jgi:phosphatidylglycerol---prolipoprotein diacylglyceryl transferase
MRRILFRWGRITIYSYPALLYVGLVLGLFAQAYASTLDHLDSTRTVIATLIVLPTAILGARLLFVVTHWRRQRQQTTRIWRSAEGGASLYGGILLAGPLSLPVLSVLKLSAWAFWDVASFNILVGMIVGRIGCFLNGCCAGRTTDSWLGVRLPDYRGVWQRRVPTQCIEALWASVVLIGGIALWPQLPFDGALFLYTVAAYSAGRFVLERTRQDQERICGVSVPRAFATMFVTASLVLFAIRWMHHVMK